MMSSGAVHHTVIYVRCPPNPPGGTQYLTIVFLPFPEQALGPTLPYPRMPYALTQYLTLVFTFPECSGWVGSTLQ